MKHGACRRPDAGAMLGEQWSSRYYHSEQKLLVVYIDDLKMAGPT